MAEQGCSTSLESLLGDGATETCIRVLYKLAQCVRCDMMVGV